MSDIFNAYIELFKLDSPFDAKKCFNNNLNDGYASWSEVVFSVKVQEQEQRERQDDTASTADNNNEAAKQT